MKKNKRKKEEIAEDYCFICKDGGLLLVCEYKHCLKAYHPQCVGKDSTFLDSGARWTCSWHSCFICHKSPKFHCFCCPNAVCQRCISAAAFVHFRGKKGFCNDCLKLALLIEENVDVDSDGGKVDFKDRETYEFLFKEYWELIKDEEGLTLANLHSADALLKKGENYKISNLDRFGKGEEEDQLFSDLDNRVEDGLSSLMEKSKGQYMSMKRRTIKSKKMEFIGWGSKRLLDFLESIHKDTSKQLSQYDVADIVNAYVRERNLINPVKKKKVQCDKTLQKFFGRKSVNRHKIYDLLESHFAENQEPSEEDEFRFNSEDEENELMASKRQRKSTWDKSHQKEKVIEAPRSCFASVIAKNIKLVYLKRNLVEDFLKHQDTFEDKVIGSFVRVNSDANDCFQRNSHQIVQVTGIKKASGAGDVGTEILLQVSHLNKDIRICMLSDDEFSELLQTSSEQLRLLQEVPKVIADEIELEICRQDSPEDGKLGKDCLLRSVLIGASEIPSGDLSMNGNESCVTFVRKDTAGKELKKPKHLPSPHCWLVNEAVLLELTRKYTDIASNDDLCLIPLHVSNIPGVGASINENAASKIVISYSAGNGDESDVINESTAKKEAEGIGAAFMISREDEMEQKQNHSGVSVPEEQSESSVAKELHLQFETFVRENQSDAFDRGERPQSSAFFADEQKNQPVEVEEKSSREIHIVNLDEDEGVQGEVQVIELSDDDEEPNATRNQSLENPESLVWHYVDPQGLEDRPDPRRSNLIDWCALQDVPKEMKIKRAFVINFLTNLMVVAVVCIDLRGDTVEIRVQILSRIKLQLEEQSPLLSLVGHAIWPPSLGWMKINCDSATNEPNNMACAAVVAKDYKGNTIATSTRLIHGSNVDVAEAMTLRLSVDLVIEKGWSKVWLESNSLSLVHFLQ
ncbi:hypothetical protein HHK36_008899 [Tetracentron sinense]|uniref:Uncharacterized protein n=1 Tax=Tetracentron sinense TaxID=13715 RepID=A0A835DHV7_TETSI|nr:hypothetical protein HHK36_008899 [Tetracentron sinense]